MIKIREKMEEMLKLRASLGYDEVSCRNMLNPFMKFCEANYPDAETITKDMVDGWIKSHGYTTNTQSSFICSLRNFCRYLCYMEPGSFFPGEEYDLKRIPYEAHPLDKDGLRVLFQAIDSYTPSTCGKQLHGDQIFPVLFRMMFCLGLRPGEPLRLRRDDVDLETGDVYIRQSKGHRDRHLFMSPELRELCGRYDNLHSKERVYFFELKGKRMRTSWMTENFKRIAGNAGLPSALRPYDLRHTFASQNLIRWMDEGKEAMDLMPYLSQFMGHSGLSQTCYYIHLLPEEIRRCAMIDWQKLDSIYGGSADEDE